MNETPPAPAPALPAAGVSGSGAPKFRRILLLCVGNVCRSPMAVSVLRQQLQDKGVEVESAGLKAMAGRPIDPRAEAVLAAHGLGGQVHEARQVSRELVDAADLVLLMEKRHLPVLLDVAPHARGKCFLLGKWLGEAEIPDPYRKSDPAFELTFELIERAVTRWRTFL